MQMKQYAKTIDGKTVIKTRNQIVVHITKEVNGEQKTFQVINPTEEMILADGWVEYNLPEPTAEDIEEYNVMAEIDQAKQELQDSDYKVIKCMEAYLCGEELPYDIKELHCERNGHRDKINLHNKG